MLFNQALHWDGKKWRLVSTPNPGGRSQNDINSLLGVRCTSVRDCWAGGLDGIAGHKFSLHNEMLHWNGTRWALAFVPSPGGTARGDINEISGLSCTAAANCWAVGFFGNINKTNRALNLLLHWNGKKWFAVLSPDPGGTGPDDSSQLGAVRCVSATDCWAVGNEAGSGDPDFNEILHWNGKKWITNIPRAA